MASAAAVAAIQERSVAPAAAVAAIQERYRGLEAAVAASGSVARPVTEAQGVAEAAAFAAIVTGPGALQGRCRAQTGAMNVVETGLGT